MEENYIVDNINKKCISNGFGRKGKDDSTMDMDIPKDDDIEMEEKVELSGSIDKITEHKVWGAQGFIDIPNQGKTYRKRYLGNRYQ